MPISNPKPDLYNINAYTKFGESPLIFTQVISSGHDKSEMSWANNSIKDWGNFSISNPKPDLHNISAQTKLIENPLTFTWYKKNNLCVDTPILNHVGHGMFTI